MSAFIYENLKYPNEAAAQSIKGVVRIKIDIDYKGNVIGSHIVAGLDDSCNAEAKRIVTLLKFEINKKLQRGKIRYHKTLNIKFPPPKSYQAKKKEAAAKVKYHITLKKKKKELPTGNLQKTYSYTIKF